MQKLYTLIVLIGSLVCASPLHSRVPKIVVVGAGLSGLTNAYKLQKEGLDVELYEARNRVGGRVFSVEIAGHIAELGAQNIRDGGEAENTFALIEELGLKTVMRQSLLYLRYFERGEFFDIGKIIRERGFIAEELETKLKTIGSRAQNMHAVLKALFDIEAVEYGTIAKILASIEEASWGQGSVTNGRIVISLNGDCHVVNMYYAGHCGRFTEQTLEQTLQEDLPLVEKIYALRSGAYPRLALDCAFDTSEGPIGHCWLTDLFALGSYSCIGAGKEAAFTTTEEIGEYEVKTLFAPIDGRLFFAGEHASTLFHVGGTMEAAIDAGMKAADMIVERVRHE